MITNPKVEKADIFMRHGSFKRPKLPTYRNFQIFITDINLPLTKEGRVEVEESFAKILGTQLIDFILSSPYRRAQESTQVTQKYIKEKFGRSVSIHLTDLLKEIEVGLDVLSRKNFYSLLLKNFGNMEYIKEAVFDKWRLGKAKEKPEEVKERIRKLLVKIWQLHKEDYKRILLVSHASFGRALRRFLEGREITLPRKEDKSFKKAEVFYISPSSQDDNFKLVES